MPKSLYSSHLGFLVLWTFVWLVGVIDCIVYDPAIEYNPIPVLLGPAAIPFRLGALLLGMILTFVSPRRMLYVGVIAAVHAILLGAHTCLLLL